MLEKARQGRRSVVPFKVPLVYALADPEHLCYSFKKDKIIQPSLVCYHLGNFICRGNRLVGETSRDHEDWLS